VQDTISNSRTGPCTGEQIIELPRSTIAAIRLKIEIEQHAGQTPELSRADSGVDQRRGCSATWRTSASGGGGLTGPPAERWPCPLEWWKLRHRREPQDGLLVHPLQRVGAPQLASVGGREGGEGGQLGRRLTQHGGHPREARLETLGHRVELLGHAGGVGGGEDGPDRRPSHQDESAAATERALIKGLLRVQFGASSRAGACVVVTCQS
jgi:hypothetical protein